MKKFTKIFAILLTVCLLVGVFAVVAFADEKVEKTTLGKDENFESQTGGTSYSGFPSGSNNANTYSDRNERLCIRGGVFFGCGAV